MKAITLGIAAFVAVTTVDIVQALTWRTYHNPRFGATADVPADWVPQPPPENGDGLVFQSPDGRATMTVSGILRVGPMAEEIASRSAPDEGEEVTLKQVGLSSVVMSGFTGKDRDVIFYRRSVTSCRDQIWNSISIEYPAAQKIALDPIVTHASLSLRGGTGWMCK